MASFKSHISFGVLTAVALSVLAFSLAWASIEIIPLIFVLTIIGSMLPDIDSDTGRPVKILFFTLAILSIFVTYSYLQVDGKISQDLIFKSLGSGLFVYFVVGFVFKKATDHRGIFHSIPMAIIMGLLAILVLKNYNFSNETLKVIGISVVVGYLCHLILDELNSAVNLSGIPFIPKKSLGSALKLTSDSKLSTTIMYMVLLFLLFINKNILI